MGCERNNDGPIYIYIYIYIYTYIYTYIGLLLTITDRCVIVRPRWPKYHDDNNNINIDIILAIDSVILWPRAVAIMLLCIRLQIDYVSCWVAYVVIATTVAMPNAWRHYIQSSNHLASLAIALKCPTDVLYQCPTGGGSYQPRVYISPRPRDGVGGRDLPDRHPIGDHPPTDNITRQHEHATCPGYHLHPSRDPSTQ